MQRVAKMDQRVKAGCAAVASPKALALFVVVEAHGPVPGNGKIFVGARPLTVCVRLAPPIWDVISDGRSILRWT